MQDPARQATFKRNAHIAYFRRCLQALPSQATSHDSNRITIAYFCLSGLDMLGALTSSISEQDRHDWAEWIWSLQAPTGGFRGSTFMTTRAPATSPAHLPSTYTALLCLALLRMPPAQLNVPGLEQFLNACQGSDGSFAPLPRSELDGDFQSDLRMTYCASVVAEIAGVSINSSAAVNFVKKCLTWEGGYGARPGIIEAQGGTTYCAIASLKMLNRLNSSTRTENDATMRWIIQRQAGGFQGRPGKLEDVCYSFWCGVALSIMGCHQVVNSTTDVSFLLSSQSPMGGFGKEPEDYPDPYHSYLAMAALSLHEAEAKVFGLKQLDPSWNISVETAMWLRAEMDKKRA